MNLTLLSYFAVDPGTPKVAAHLTGDTTRGCTLHISWIVPGDTTVSDIKHFMIFIDGVNVHNETNPENETFLSLSYLGRTCTPHNTSVSIVNRCDRVGPSSPTIRTFSPEPLVCDIDDTVCEENTITGDCEGYINLLINYFSFNLRFKPIINIDSSICNLVWDYCKWYCYFDCCV